MHPPAALTGALTLISRTPTLWPGFAPERTPLLTFDGTHTWLHHADPTGDGWNRVHGAWVWPGRHPALTAHTAVTLPGGLDAAGVLLADLPLPSDPDQAARTLAATLIHEAFHVYQGATPSPAWPAPELAALTYPAGTEIRHARAEETHWLRLALRAGDGDWTTPARHALHWRARRHAQLDADHQQFETRMETTEGLALYVETRFLADHPDLDPDAATRQTPRGWSYRSGAALAHLLERTGTSWPVEVLAGHPLADLLTGQVGSPLPAALHPDLESAARAAAGAHDADLSARLAAFHAQPGPVLHLSSPGGLRLGGFDPMNLHAVGPGTFLHARHVGLRTPDVELLTVGHPALTRGPSLFDVHEVTLRALPAPAVHEGRWRIRTPTLTLDLPGHAVHRTPDGWSVRLG
ncbi:MULTISPECIES: hypothetical protein [unclassified Deinococcus]|uniref:hypothetical protein n=1 Tax=unclassified Deinococcus TaxID=2623546 RepID=UPI001C2F2286|nr:MULTISPECIES: hypothetical protein [unclassified Deinococcus]MDK2013387.1 hypothetical protein [Deinococcus sp. 43]